jgi:23S rRNA (cytosine1962-C5)-methyltransferase
VSPAPVLADLLAAALDARGALLAQLSDDSTDCMRLFHGAVEGLPGVAIDRYGPEVLVQVWREEAMAAIDVAAIQEVVCSLLGMETEPRLHPRGRWASRVGEPGSPAEGMEAGLRFDVTAPAPGRDPLLFLDFRAGRRAVRAHGREGSRVLNLFAYTCGVGVAAAAAGASVLNVDFAASALEIGAKNAARNALQRFDTLKEDVFPVIRQLSGLGIRGRVQRTYTPLEPARFDLVVLDPPRWAKSPFGAVDLVRDYPALLKPALLCTAEGGELLVTNNVSSVTLDDWLEVVRRCAQKAGRPIRELNVIRPDSDFPSPDGRHPLKMAWLRL